MSRAKTSLYHKRIQRLIWLVLTVFFLLSCPLQSARASAYYSMVKQASVAIDSPRVILGAGNYSGTTTIYANNTSAKVNVTAPEYQYVTQQSNIDGVADVGTHSNFTAQQYGPDNINDTLTEANTVSNIPETYVYGNAASGWATTPTYVYDNNTATYAQAASITGPAWTPRLVMNLTATTVGTKIQYWVSQSNAGIYTTMNITIANATGSWTIVYSATPTQGSYQNCTFSSSSYTAIGIERYRPSGSTSRTARANEMQAVNATWSPPANYRLDLEEQWTNANYTRANRELDILTGTFNAGGKTLGVQWWNTTSSTWLTIISSLNASSWNNVTVVDYLTSSNFTIQFVSTTSGTTQSWWQIDCALLHLWTATYNYVLKVVNQFNDNWTINLQVYNASNIAPRSLTTTISFHDGSSSDQIIVNNGIVTLPQGQPYNLTGNATIYISMSNLQASASGTSDLYVYLKILTPGTSTYLRYIITFEIA